MGKSTHRDHQNNQAIYINNNYTININQPPQKPNWLGALGLLLTFVTTIIKIAETILTNA